jgi:Holliday junction DNA helicase RuvA
MIGYLSGKILNKKPTQLLLDVNGVGYIVNISLNTFEKLPDEKQTASLYTYLSVREDALVLFGFSTESEKQMFELLISVNGIGPKLAQGILSGIQIDELKQAIVAGDMARIVAVPGIGRKTAERLMLDLRDKVEKVSAESAPGSSLEFTVRTDALSALTTLGFNAKIAEKAIRDILAVTPDIHLEELLRQAISLLNN